MKINEVIATEGFFSKKPQQKSEKKIVVDYADQILSRYTKKYGKKHGVVEFDNKIGGVLRDVIAVGISNNKLLPNYNDNAVKEMVDHYITDSYMNFKLNGQVDDVVGHKVFQYA